MKMCPIALPEFSKVLKSSQFRSSVFFGRTAFATTTTKSASCGRVDAGSSSANPVNLEMCVWVLKSSEMRFCFKKNTRIWASPPPPPRVRFPVQVAFHATYPKGKGGGQKNHTSIVESGAVKAIDACGGGKNPTNTKDGCCRMA